MGITKTFKVGYYTIEIILPDENDLKGSTGNNINAYDKTGRCLWNISQLLQIYSDKNGLKYFDELYFDIRIIDNDTIFCIGFTNHCEVDLKSMYITKLVNNK